ncbi:MAG: GTP-binding protein [Rhodobacteraceae bacterium]|nr:MAG: GTP-binding protein [Paracoccaceae bacterium]
MHDPIPVTLLTGFLGAGKTTILNHLLRDPAAGRIAVVVNEFGEAGLDHDLIETAAEDVVLMPAGCICCSIRGDLSKTLSALFARRLRQELAFDRLVIETTGLADPGPIHHTLLIDPVLSANYVFDGIVTAVDAVLATATLDQHLEAQAQVAMADRIIVTKSDLADARTIAALQLRLDQLNPGAPRLTADKGTVPAQAVLGPGRLRRATSPRQALDWLAAPQTRPAPAPLEGLSGLTRPGTAAPAQPAASHHTRDGRITTASITLTDPIPAERFDFWLDTLIALRGDKILRMKGIAYIEGCDHPFAFHGVQSLFDPPVPLTHLPRTEPTSRVVIIARDMPRAELEESLALLRHGPEALGLAIPAQDQLA